MIINYNRILSRYKNVLIVLGLIIYFMFIRKHGQMSPTNQLDIFVGVILAGYFSSMGFLEKMRRESPQIQGVKHHDSLGVEPVPFNCWDGLEMSFFQLGGIMSNGLHLSGSNGFLLVPSSYVLKQGQEYTYQAIKQEVSLESYPEEVQNYVKDNRLPPPYYLALTPSKHAGHTFLADEEVNPTSIIAKQELQNTKLTALLTGDYQTVRKFTSEASHMVNSLDKGKGIIEALKGVGRK
jgi:hypothetical protein